MRSWLSLSLVVLLGIALGSVAMLDLGPAASAQSGAGGRPFKPVAPLLVVMETVDDLFVPFEEKVKGKLEKKSLKALAKDAQLLAELFNVASYHKQEPDWQKWAVDNREQFQKFASDCEKGNTKTLRASYETINKTCDACHKKYRDE